MNKTPEMSEGRVRALETSAAENSFVPRHDRATLTPAQRETDDLDASEVRHDIEDLVEDRAQLRTVGRREAAPQEVLREIFHVTTPQNKLGGQPC
jgi:hypothetical protein